MSNVIVLPRIRMIVEQLSGYVEYGGCRYGVLITPEQNRVRYWCVVDGRSTNDPIPEEVGAWIQKTTGEILYRNHFDQVTEQLTREPRSLPSMQLDSSVRDIFAFRPEHFQLLSYDPYPAIKAAVSV